MVLEVFWAQMCTMEVLYIGVHSSGNSSLEFLELEPHVYLLRQIPMVSVLSNMLSKSMALLNGLCHTEVDFLMPRQ